MSLGKVVIAGGGVGGLTLAKLLLKNGVEVNVLERASTFQQSGEILLQPCGARVLDEAGLLQAATTPDCCLRHSVMEIRHAKGLKLFDRVNLTPQHSTTASDLGARCTRRQGFIEALHSTLPTGVVRLGCKVLKVSQSDKFVTVDYEVDGHRETVSCDVVVGADGKNSRVRQDLWEGDEPAKQFAEFVCITWTVDLSPAGNPLLELYEERKMQSTWGVGALLGLMPIAQHVCCAFACVHQDLVAEAGLDLEHLRSAATRGASRSPETQQSMRVLVRHVARQYVGQVRLRFDYAVEHALWGDVDRGPYLWSVDEMPPPSTLSRHRAALLGDAAHLVCPLTGMGANLALEDAYVLSEALAAVNRGELALHSALEQYSSLRIPRIRRIVEYSHTKRLKRTWRELTTWAFQTWFFASFLPALLSLVAPLSWIWQPKSASLVSARTGPADPTDSIDFDVRKVWAERPSTREVEILPCKDD